MKSKKLNGFDRIAPVYDRLARLVFGKSIRNAQLYFLSDIPKRGSVLILGGGTGWLLVELLKVNPDCNDHKIFILIFFLLHPFLR